jgi:4,4'-diaponeurosporenoate glycosyltransferase
MFIDVDVFGALFSWDVIVYVVASLSGLFAIFGVRTLPAVSGRRPRVAVIIPARDEERNIAAVVGSIVPHLKEGDEIVVVDDHSRDATAALAASAGARVVAAPELPDGWMGKPHACWSGVGATTAEVLVFVDADVRMVNPTVVDRLACLAEFRPTTLVSVQPWHLPGGVAERWAAMFNVVSIMGSGAGRAFARPQTALAFGPVLACRRDSYERLGGHAHASVRSSVIEDVALGALFGTTDVYVGSGETVTFRMYPGGFRSMVNGFTKNIAAGLGRARVVDMVAAALWVAALVGALFTSPILYVASVAQVAIVQRRVGRFGPLIALAYPVSVAVLIAVLVRSALVASGVGRVAWAGRRLP